jgi:DNA-binding transcriptional MerR regulator
VATIGEAARRFGVSPQTVRGWCDTFKEFLSPSATPPMGETRILTLEDLEALALVAKMRQSLSATDSIKAALAAGERVEIEEEPGEDFYPPAPILAAELAKREGQLEELREERDHLRGELDKERTARLEALERAARAEARLEAREEQGNQQSTPQQSADSPRRRWWEVWRKE